jgi:Patatin-like phospholipase
MVNSVKNEACPWAEVLSGEHEAINSRRKKYSRKNVTATHAIKTMAYGASGDFDTVGLCLSGGGIRSAAFCLGALQALQAHKKFDEIDYLSTVSGGGYIGASLSSALSLQDGIFPFVKSGKDMSDTEEIGHLRDYSNYLVPRGNGDLLADFTIVLRGWVAIAMMVVPVLLLFAALTVYLNPVSDSAPIPKAAGALNFSSFNQWPFFEGRFAWSASLALLLPFLFALWAFFRSVFTIKDSEFAGPIAKIATFALGSLALVAFGELQPVIVWGMYQQFHPEIAGVGFDYFGWIKSVLSLMFPILGSVWLFAKQIAAVMNFAETAVGYKSVLAKIIARIIVWVAALALPVILWALYLFLVYWAIPALGKVDAPAWMWRVWGALDHLPKYKYLPPFAVVYVLVAFGLMVINYFITANSNSLHSLYRDRLGAAFLWAKRESDGSSANTMNVSKLDPELAPYHILNTALNIQGSPDANRRGRNADFYHLGMLYSGSESTGYVRTTAIEEQNKELSLASAMAISGAAISSNMGSASIRPLTPTLALLNLRLGYWLKNPLPSQMTSNSLFLLREMFSRLRPTSKWLYLTDGGHIENLGLYELLRRRCSKIIVIDAEADPQMNFGAMVKLERYARIDLGVRINISWDAIAKTTLAARTPGAPRAHGPHCAIGEITYSNGGKGHLIYVKSSLSGDENDYVRDYARRNPDFPHQTTSDQFFNEEQFEVYRALGFHCVYGMFKKTGGDAIAKPEGPPEIFSRKKLQNIKSYDYRDVLNL